MKIILEIIWIISLHSASSLYTLTQSLGPLYEPIVSIDLSDDLSRMIIGNYGNRVYFMNRIGLYYTPVQVFNPFQSDVESVGILPDGSMMMNT